MCFSEFGSEEEEGKREAGGEGKREAGGEGKGERGGWMNFR